MTTLKSFAVLAVLLAAGCADKTKEADRLNAEVKSEVCRIKETLPPISAALAAAERDVAVAGALEILSEKARKSPTLIAKTREVNALVKDFKPSDRFTYLFDASRLDESTVRQIVEAQCPFEYIDDAVDAAEAPAADAMTEASADAAGLDEAAMAAAEDAGIAAADAQFAAEAERERLLAEAEVARARKEALQAERELLAEQRRQAEQSAQMAAAAPKLSCPYHVANPLKCASRDRQPTACAWDFEACGMPRLFKQESKTTCTGKMSADQAAGRIIIVDGCRGLFVPEF